MGRPFIACRSLPLSLPVVQQMKWHSESDRENRKWPSSALFSTAPLVFSALHLSKRALTRMIPEDRGSHQGLTDSTVLTGYTYQVGGAKQGYNTMSNQCSNPDFFTLNVEGAQYTPIQGLIEIALLLRLFRLKH